MPIIMFMILSLTWFISTWPFLIPYYWQLTAQSKKMDDKLPIGHFMAVSFFVYYLTGVLSFTQIPSINDIVGIIAAKGPAIAPGELNLFPFRWLTGGIRPYLENIVLFIPLGVLLPCIWEKYAGLWKTALSGLTFSLLIELSQLFNQRVTDIDDLLMNTLGAVIGWGIFRLLNGQLAKLQSRICVLHADRQKMPLLLREEARFYMAGAFAGLSLVYDPFFGPLVHALLAS